MQPAALLVGKQSAKRWIINMQNKYYSMNITSPQNLIQSGYQVVDASGNATLVDSSGNPITLPRVYEYIVTSPDEQSPAWGS